MTSTEAGAKSQVVPFGLAPAAACTPSSPARFSTRTGWPSARDRRSPITRAARSGALPAVSVTINRSGCAGQACPEPVEWVCAAAGAASDSAKNAAARTDSARWKCIGDVLSVRAAMLAFPGMNRYVLVTLLAAFLAAFLEDGVFAQAYPSKPIRLIVPFAAGGGNDNVARLVGKRLADGLGQPVLVDNGPGAGGVVGAELAAKSAPDGYTLFLGGVGSHAINPNLHPKLPYDPIRDFAPVALLAQAPLILVVHPSVPARDIAEFIAYPRANPGRLNFASNGNGSSSQVAAVMFDSMAGVDMVHVPYKGLSPALADLLSGQVQVMFSSVVAILPHIKAGQLRRPPVTRAQRLPSMPQLP